jgi:hypothetical protein
MGVPKISPAAAVARVFAGNYYGDRNNAAGGIGTSNVTDGLLTVVSAKSQKYY